MEYKYNIQYEGYKYDLVKCAATDYHFNKVKDCANKKRIELTEKEFELLFILSTRGSDIEWIIRGMKGEESNPQRLAETLVSYMSF